MMLASWVRRELVGPGGSVFCREAVVASRRDGADAVREGAHRDGERPGGESRGSATPSCSASTR